MDAQNVFLQKLHRVLLSRFSIIMESSLHPLPTFLKRLAFPIFTFSTGSQVLTGCFVAENMPDNLRWWLQGYNDEIQYAIDNRVVAPINTEKEWSDLERGLSNRTRISKVVEPLITSKWGQNSPYNLQCPEGTSSPYRVCCYSYGADYV